jgi:polyisoprenoid-binding protein YceI
VSEHGGDGGSPGPAALAGASALLADGTMTGQWVLDPAGSRVEFHAKHFWGAVTVHGTFDAVAGEGSVSADGTITGRLTMDASSLSTGNKQRDKHLRSADFFTVERHGNVVVTVTSAEPGGQAALACHGTLEAAGHSEPVEFTAHIREATGQAVVLDAEIVIDRTLFATTWSPLGMAAAMARGTVIAR